MAALIAPPALADIIAIRPDHDNTIYGDSDFQSNAFGNNMFIGKNSQGGARRSLVSFDIASAVPAGSTINSVTLTVRCTRSRGGSAPVDLHRLTASWGEVESLAQDPGGSGAPAGPGDATWADRYFAQAMPWATPGGDFVPAVTSTVNIGSSGVSYTWQTTARFVADVQGMLDAPASNFGWIIIGNEGASATAKRLASRENPTASYRPTLTINYTAVPAPGAAGLLAVAGVLAGRRRRR
jgi:hypothetical protein